MLKHTLPPLAVLVSRPGRSVNRRSPFRPVVHFPGLHLQASVPSMKWHCPSTLFSVFLFSYSQERSRDRCFFSRDLSSRRMMWPKYINFVLFTFAIVNFCRHVPDARPTEAYLNTEIITLLITETWAHVACDIDAACIDCTNRSQGVFTRSGKCT